MNYPAKYRKVAFFGLWAEEGAHELGAADAFDLLHKAAQRAYNEDIREKNLESAIKYLSTFAVRQRPFDDFRKAMDIENSALRMQALYDALHRIAREI